MMHRGPKAVCDVCGCVIYRADGIYITDKYNELYGKLVCKKDYVPTHPLSRPQRPIIERTPSNPASLRPEQPPVLRSFEYADRLPSAPQNLRSMNNPLTGNAIFIWDGPIDGGSGAILGYRIQIADPMESGYVDIIPNTGSAITTYQYSRNTTVTGLTAYIRVAAINEYGQGPYSFELLWPAPISYDTLNFLTVSDDGNVLTDGDSNPFILVG